MKKKATKKSKRVSHASGIKAAYKKGKKIPPKKASKKKKKHGGYRQEAVDASMGNEWWKNRAKHGRDKLFEDPELLWEAACEYFKWSMDNPLKESRLASVKGYPTVVQLSKIRAFTLKGLCLYLGCNENYFRTWRSRGVEGFDMVIEQIEQTIYKQKFDAAAADLLNANIISRDLGLKEQSEVDINMPRKSVDDLFPDEKEFSNEK